MLAEAQKLHGLCIESWVGHLCRMRFSTLPAVIVANVRPASTLVHLGRLREKLVMLPWRCAWQQTGLAKLPGGAARR